MSKLHQPCLEKAAILVVTSVSIFDGIFWLNSSNIFTNGMTADLNRLLLAAGGPEVNLTLMTPNKIETFTIPKEL